MFASCIVKSFLARAVIACASLLLAAPAALATMVRVPTALGPVDIELFDTAAPATVANYLRYLRAGAYNNTFFHRSIRGFVVQGGGYTWTDGAGGQPVKVPAAAPVVNEFSATRSNLRGTVAMAKLGDDPNSATSEWFVNLADNALNLDNQNGGFTVFGRVTTAGMAVMDAIADLPVVAANTCTPTSGALSNLPVIKNITSCAALNTSTLVMTGPVIELPTVQSDSDRIFNYLEAAFPGYAAPASPTSGTVSGYYFRYYAKTASYIATKDGQLYFLAPNIRVDVFDLGTVAQWLAIAAAAGY